MHKVIGPGSDPGLGSPLRETGKGQASGDLTGTRLVIALARGSSSALTEVCHGIRTRPVLIMNRNGHCRESPTSGSCRTGTGYRA